MPRCQGRHGTVDCGVSSGASKCSGKRVAKEHARTVISGEIKALIGVESEIGSLVEA